MVKCSEDDCSEEAKKRGLCEKHYLRERRAGRLALHAPMPRGRKVRTWEVEDFSINGVCRAVECNEPATVHGLCHDCYSGLRRKGLIVTDQLIRQRKMNASSVCAVEGCLNKPRHRGLCSTHYHRWNRYGDPTFLPMRTLNRGKPRVDAKGYRVLWMPDHPMARKNGYVFEHRIVMASIIGRDLFANERPHHVNGRRSDNRPKNLELWVTSQPAGQRVQDLVAWAKEILLAYPDDLLAKLST